jgi:hypothetical protein
MELFEQVGTRQFSARLEPNGIIVIHEGHDEVGRMTLCDALASLAKERDDQDILEATIGDTLRALMHEYGRVV